MFFTLIRILSSILLVSLAFVIGWVVYQANDTISSVPFEKFSSTAKVKKEFFKSTQVFDSKGSVISSIDDQEPRFYLHYNEFPRSLILAVLSIEDKNFFKHSGISVPDILRAIKVNLNKGRIVQGASTISQQTARMLFLNNNRTLLRKVREVALTFLLEHKWTKQQILEIYLNKVFLGNNSYGFSMASYRYFAKSLEELSLDEIALLAGLPKAPSSLAPNRHYQKSIRRRNQVLKEMLEANAITKVEYEEALAKRTVISKSFTQNKLSFFNDSVKSEMRSVLGKSNWQGGGSKVYTTFDSYTQSRLQRVLRFIDNQLPDRYYPTSEIELAGVVVNANSGAIKAEQGSRSFRLSQFNRVRQMQRSFPNAISPILTHHALEKSFLFSHTLFGSNSTLFENFCFPGDSDFIWHHAYWGPSFDFKLRKMGFSKNYVLSKGRIPTSVGKIAELYYSLGAGKEFKSTYRVRKIEDASGNTIYQNSDLARKQKAKSLAREIFDLGWQKCSHTWGQKRFWQEGDAYGYVGYDEKLHNSFAVYLDDREVIVLWVGAERGLVSMKADDLSQVFFNGFSLLYKTKIMRQKRRFPDRRRMSNQISFVPLKLSNNENVMIPIPTRFVGVKGQQNTQIIGF